MAADLSFTNPELNHVRNQYSQESCKMLYSQTLSDKAFVTATGFIPTQRIKKWKPNRLIDTENSYCFIDNDADNAKQDNLMKSLTCSKDDPIFAQSDFITNVFVDNSPDNTQNFPFNKCVIEIDPKKVTEDKLNVFWSRISDAECDALFSDIRKENKNIEDYLNDLKNKYNIARNKIADLDQYISNSQRDESILKTDINDINTKNALISPNITTFNNHINDLTSSIIALLDNHKSVANNLELQATDCQNAVYSLSNQNKTLEESISNITKQITRIRTEYNIMRNAFENLTKQKESLDKDSALLLIEIQKKKDALKQCESNRHKCNEERTTYKVLEEQLIKQINDLKVNLQTCTTELNTCTIDRNNLALELESKKQYVSDRTSWLKSLMEVESECANKLKYKETQSHQLQIIIDNWRRDRRDCSDLIRKIASLEEDIRGILVWCRLASRNSLQGILQYRNHLKLDADMVRDARNTVCKKEKPQVTALPSITPSKYDYAAFLRSYRCYFIDFKQHGKTNGPLLRVRLIGSAEAPFAQNFAHEAVVDAILKPDNRGKNELLSGLPSGNQEKHTSKGIMPRFVTGSFPTDSMYFYISPIFRVSQTVVAKLKFGVDDEATVWVNGTLIARGTYTTPVDITYTFQENMPYVIVTSFVNGDHGGSLNVENGFDEVVPLLLLP